MFGPSRPPVESIYVDDKAGLWSVHHRRGLDDDEANMELIPMPGTFVKFPVTSFGKNAFLE